LISPVGRGRFGFCKNKGGNLAATGRLGIVIKKCENPLPAKVSGQLRWILRCKIAQNIASKRKFWLVIFKSIAKANFQQNFDLVHIASNR
jgi:hypothetical protein